MATTPRVSIRMSAMSSNVLHRAVRHSPILLAQHVRTRISVLNHVPAKLLALEATALSRTVLPVLATQTVQQALSVLSRTVP